LIAEVMALCRLLKASAAPSASIANIIMGSSPALPEQSLKKRIYKFDMVTPNRRAGYGRVRGRANDKLSYWPMPGGPDRKSFSPMATGVRVAWPKFTNNAIRSGNSAARATC